MPKIAIRVLELAALLIAVSLIVATSPNDYFFGQVIDIPQFTLSSELPGHELAAVVTMDEGTDFTPPCQALFMLSATNESSSATTIELWTLPEEWDGSVPTEPLGDDDDSAPSEERGADDDDSAADDDDSAADDDDSAADDDDSATDDDDSATDDDDSADDDDDSATDDDDSADDDDDSAAEPAPVAEEIIQTTVAAGESTSIGLMLEVSCEGAPFRVLTFAHSEGQINLILVGTLEVTTQDFAGSGSVLSCSSTPVDSTLEGMHLDFL